MNEKEGSIDSRRARSEATKDALMRAAERLIAERGVENVSIREIVAAAKQKNESALQYHFKNLTGLIEAIHDQRSEQIQHKRAALLEAKLAHSSKPALRELCALMIEPAFQLARSHQDFRNYIKAFGHILALAETSPVQLVQGKESANRLAQLLIGELPHLDKTDYRARIEAAIRLCAASMHHQARQSNAFRGKQSDVFLNHLVDALFGLLSAPVSAETQSLKKKR